MQYTEIELAKLIETVEKEFTTHLNKAEEVQASLAKSEVSASGKLAKAEDSKPPKKEEPKDKEAKAPESKEAAPAEESHEAPPAESAPAAEEGQEAPPAEGQAPAPAPAAAAAGHGYDEEDMAHMLKMYQSMSREELMAHHDCVRQCLDAMSAEQAPAVDKCGDMMMGKSEIEDENPELNSKPKAGGKDMNADAKNGGIEGQAPSGPKGARSEASKDSKNLKDAMAKTERQERNGGKIEESPVRNSPGAKSPASNASKAVQMDKSENIELELIKSELAAEKAKGEELKKSFDKATELLTNVVKKMVPQGKAITSLDVIEKSESFQEDNQLSKSEVTQLLAKKDQTKLTKADRDAINSYYLDNSDFNTISHLLKN